jgi:hypothetical protein
MKIQFLLPAVALLALGCSAGSHDAAGSDIAGPASNSPGGAGMRTAVIRKATLRIRVENVEKSEKDVQRILASHGGYIERAESSDLNGTRPEITITLRVPESKLQTTLEGLESLGVRLSKTIEGEDVTTQIVDIQARLKTMRAQEESYRKMLAGTQSLTENMQISDKLMQLRGTIESHAAQLQSLSNLAALSTVTVTLQQSAESMAKVRHDPNWFAETLAGATSAFMIAFRAAVGFLVWLVLFAPFWLPIAWFARKAKRLHGRARFEI